MKWLDALKQWNAGTGGRWTIPKKGTKEHDQVLAIQGRTGAEDEDEEAKRIVDDAIAMGAEEPTPKPQKKARKPRAKKDQGGYSAE